MSDTAEHNLATVIAITTNGLTLRFDGENEARMKPYKCLSSYIPTIGDRVYIVAISGTYLVIGEVVDQPITSLTAANALKLNGKAESELSVANATNATNATDAANAAKLGGKLESELSVATAANAANASKLNNKAESALSVGSANRADRVIDQGSTSSDIYFRSGASNTVQMRRGTGGTWQTIATV